MVWKKLCLTIFSIFNPKVVKFYIIKTANEHKNNKINMIFQGTFTFANEKLPKLSILYICTSIFIDPFLWLISRLISWTIRVQLLHEPSVVVVQVGQKAEWVVISESDNRPRWTGPHVHFKMLECQQQSEGFFLNDWILDLMLVEPAWEVANWMMDYLIIVQSCNVS